MSGLCFAGAVLAVICAGAGAHPLDLSGATIVYRAEAPPLERFAALELRRYLSQLTGKVVPVVADGKLPEGVAVLVGSAADPLGHAGRLPDALGGLEEDFMLAVVGRRVVVRGRGAVGTLYAVYTLLEELGMGFYLGGDAYPSPPVALTLPGEFRRTVTPVFKIRGSLPWYNFLNSPTTWNREDFKAFFDQMSKMKMNFVGFHTYDYEPFGAYRDEGGKLVMGQPLKTSMDYGWGATGHLTTAEFGWGTGRYFDRTTFGSHATTDAKGSDDAILRAERDLREGLAYARSRGIHVCVGFEMTGDPHDAANQRRFRRRLVDLLSDYPMIDYVWMWQTEGLGGGSGLPAHGTLARARMEQLRPTFAYLAEDKRIGEAARMTDFILLAHRILQQVAPDKRMIVSGWGGDRWMRFSDFYLGLDKVLPKDIVFAALDNIDPTAEENVSKVYGQVSPDRERWPIPWFESDGGGSRRDQWGPQPNVAPFTHLCLDARRKGCQGLLGIHWRTRAVEEVAAYVAQFAWDPTLTYERFYDGFAARCYGKQHAKEMSAIHRELESMGSRWSGTVGQVECGGFSWASDGKKPDPKKLARLDEIAKRLAQIRGELTSPKDVSTTPAQLVKGGVHLERLEYLIATIEWLTRYDRAIERLLPDGPVEQALVRAARARDDGRKQDAETAALEAWQQVRTSGFGDAVRTYARKLSNQGEFGVLATVNVKAVVTYRKLIDRIAAFLPVGPPLELMCRRTAQDLVVSWGPAARAAGYRVWIKPTKGDLRPAGDVKECRIRLKHTFAGEVHVRGAAKDGVEGPPSEPLTIPERVSFRPGVGGRSRPNVTLARPSTSYGAGETAAVRAAIVGEGPIRSAKVRALGGGAPIPMKVEFGETHRAEVPVPPAAIGTAPPWLQYCMVVAEEGGATVKVPATGFYSATIEPRPFARVWPPLSDVPPVASKDWPVVVRVAVDGSSEGVSVRLAVHGGGEVVAEPVPHGSYRAVVPGSAIRDPQLEFAAVVTRPGVEPVRSPMWTFPTDRRPPASPAQLRVTSPRRYQAMVRWEPAADDTGSTCYKIEKDGKPVAETAQTRWLDGRLVAGVSARYRVTPVDRAGRSGTAATVAWKAPDWPPPKPPTGLKAVPGFGLVALTWTAPEDDVRFRVLRSEAKDGDYRVVSGKEPIGGVAFVDHPPAANRGYFWRVVAVDPADERSRPSAAVTASARPVPQEPILVADFDSPETTGKLHGGARLGKGRRGRGLDLSAGGWADFPDRSEYDDLVSFTLSLWIRPDTLDPMPVLVSHGLWGGPGVFLQFLGHRVRTYIGGGRVTDGGSPRTGVWQHIAVVREGTRLRTYLDGRLIARKDFAPSPVGAHRMPLRIGQYTHVQSVYQVKGVIDDVRLYLRPLSGGELRNLMGE